MTTPLILDGRALAAKRKAALQPRIATFTARAGRAPCLAAILVGDDPASQVYVTSKCTQCAEVGITSRFISLPAGISAKALRAEIDALNLDSSVDGILLQLPLLAPLCAKDFLSCIDPRKDVDGLTPVNQQALEAGYPQMIPCTPLGCLSLIQSVRQDLKGLHAVVIGTSALVGRPMGLLLQQQGCTVTWQNKQSGNIPHETRQADILVVATGQAELVRGSWVKEGAIVIDVGISRFVDTDSLACTLVGDVAFDEVAPKALAITPVPGGVGPMTVAMLLENTLQCAEILAGSSCV